jgi:uncharacterized protein YbcV (DUF1398 family)
MNTSILLEMTERSLAGTITFTEVVETLAKNGVESYAVDLVRSLKTHYGVKGDFFSEPLGFEDMSVAEEFNLENVIAAIKATQAGKIDYQEFLALIMKAGVSNYTVYITGKKVIYSGRKGDFHIEPFPLPKSR